MMHIILGLFLIALGVWGVMDEWYYALDSVKAAGSLILLGGGLMAFLGGVFGPRHTPSAPSDLKDALTDGSETEGVEAPADWTLEPTSRRAAESLQP